MAELLPPPQVGSSPAARDRSHRTGANRPGDEGARTGARTWSCSPRNSGWVRHRTHWSSGSTRLVSISRAPERGRRRETSTPLNRGRRRHRRGLVEHLTRRETMILELLASHLSLPEIGLRAAHLTPHGQVARATDLQQARSELAVRCGHRDAGTRHPRPLRPASPPSATRTSGRRSAHGEAPN